MTVPGAPASVTTAIDGSDVKISWDLPFTGGTGVSLTSYDIQIRKKDGTFTSYGATCDGNDNTIVTNRYCHVAMSVLTGGTFNLV